MYAKDERHRWPNINVTSKCVGASRSGGLPVSAGAHMVRALLMTLESELLQDSSPAPRTWNLYSTSYLLSKFFWPAEHVFGNGKS